MSRPDDDVEHALIELVRDSVGATQAQADAGGKIAAELSGLRSQLAILPRLETALSDATTALKATQERLIELADRRAADVRALEDQHRREGYDKGRADAAREHAESLRAAIPSAFAAELRQPAGKAAVALVILVLVAALLSPFAHLVDVAALRAVLGLAP